MGLFKPACTNQIEYDFFQTTCQYKSSARLCRIANPALGRKGDCILPGLAANYPERINPGLPVVNSVGRSWFQLARGFFNRHTTSPISRAAIRLAGSTVAIAGATPVSKEPHRCKERPDGRTQPLLCCEARYHYECSDKQEADPLDRPAGQYSVFQMIMLFFRRRYAASY